MWILICGGDCPVNCKIFNSTSGPCYTLAPLPKPLESQPKMSPDIAKCPLRVSLPQVETTALEIMEICIRTLSTLHVLKPSLFKESHKWVSGNLHRNRAFVPPNVGLSLLGDPWQHRITMLKCHQKAHLGIPCRVPNPADSISSLH